jgi:hypothetical protein
LKAKELHHSITALDNNYDAFFKSLSNKLFKLDINGKFGIDE